MESENKIWTISELNKFAQKFQKINVLCDISWFHSYRPPLENQHTEALKELAAMLGEPLDARRMEQRVYDFIGNTLQLYRDVAREGMPRESLPPALNRLGTRLELIDVASVMTSQMETGECRGDGAVNPAKVKGFATRLVKAVQRTVAERRPSGDWDTARFLQSADAVETFARETGADRGAVLQIWLRMCRETRAELSRAGREPTLSPAEWRLADLLLTHEPAPPLLERERSSRLLVHLVRAAVARLPRREGEDPVFGSEAPAAPGEAAAYGDWLRSVWTAVHIAYCKKERAVSGVLLQRRWHELRRAAHEGRASPLLPLLPPLPPPSWPTLVRRGFVLDLTALGCRNPDLLCLLDDINIEIPEHDSSYASERVNHSSVEPDGKATQEEATVRQLQASDPSRTEASILFDPRSDSEPEDAPAPPAAAPADKDDSLSFIIKQALNCRSIVRLQAPRLRELTDDILKKNCVLADKQTAADGSVIGESIPELGSEARKRPRRHSADSAKREKRSEDRGLSAYRETSVMELPLSGDKLAMETRVELERMDAPSDRTLRGLSSAELSLRHGVPGQGAAWWARNLPLAEKCRPLRVSLSRLRRQPAPRVALPDVRAVREMNRRVLTAQVAPSRPRSPGPGPHDVDPPENRRFDYLHKDMLRMMARHARRFLSARRTSPKAEAEQRERPHFRLPRPRDTGCAAPEATRQAAGILDDELSHLRRTEKSQQMPSGVRPSVPFWAKAGPSVRSPPEATPASGKSECSIIESTEFRE